LEGFRGIQLQGAKSLKIGLALPTFEGQKMGKSTISIRGSFIDVDAEVVDEDVRHDLALLKLKPNPFDGDLKASIEGIAPTIKPLLQWLLFQSVALKMVKTLQSPVIPLV
jgi:hypothetical protein